MDPRREKAEATAKAYIGTDQLFKELGSGAEGFVFPSPSATAIKVFTHREKFERELAVYERLLEHKVVDVLGFAVPRLIGSDANLMVIEMTLVQPPFLLDFAQSVLDEPLDFTEETMEDWWERVADAFGERFSVVRELFYVLQDKYGIYYYDLAPRNINFGDPA